MDGAELTGTERVIFGDTGTDAVRDRLDTYLARHLGTPVVEVLFRSGRICCASTPN